MSNSKSDFYSNCSFSLIQDEFDQCVILFCLLLWDFVVYPKVKVRVHQQENDIPPQNDHRRLLVTKVSDESLSIPGSFCFCRYIG